MILGVTARTVHAPSSLEECTEVMRRAAADRQRLGFIGGGTELGLGRAPTGLDAVVRTEKLCRVLEYAPSDMVLAVEAGVTLARVQDTVREHRQMLALDAPLPQRATIGGLVATGSFGPRRARYGAIRDLIIGVTLVRADGAVAHGGGKVVKNVAGFDLPKVVCGSLGSLGLIAAATFRLHPLPEVTATALLRGVGPDKVVSMVAAIRGAQLEPSAAAAIRMTSGGYDLALRFEGFGKGVEQQLVRLGELSPLERLASEPTFWSRHDDIRTGGSLRVRIASLPSRLPAVDGVMAPLLGAMHDGSFVWYATLGIGYAAGEPIDPRAAALAVAKARTALADAGGSLTVETAPPDVRDQVDPFGPVPGAFRLMENLKNRFDPDRRLNPGRFVGGL